MHLQLQPERRQAESSVPSSTESVPVTTESTTATGSVSSISTASATSSYTSTGSMTTRPSPTSAFLRATSTPPPPPNPSPTPTNRPEYIIPLIIVLAVLLGLFILFLSLRKIRRTHPNPKYLPTPFLKKLWQKWEVPQNSWKPVRQGNGNFEPIGTAAARRLGPPAPARSSTGLAGGNARDDGTGDIGTATVDRNTSVRSVMTLPAYRPNAHHNEQVLGREGERAGIDTVVEFPENADEEERAREEEMEALYQVRVARRRENEERDERRRLRREARDRGDFVALREIQAQSRASNAARAGRTVDELRAEHERIKRERTRAVSSVSYADLGVARHDGTRIRANSEESERTGLLGDAASFGYHRRDRSASSVLSIDTMNSDLPSPEFPHARTGSHSSFRDSSLRRMSTADGRSEISGRAGSSPELIDHEDASQNSPPEYENVATNVPNAPSPNEPPPDYTSPTVGREEGRSLTESRFETVDSRNISPDSRVGSPVRDIGPSLHPESAIESNNAAGAHSTRGVGGVPQLPSLRLSNLPSIQVDPGSPRVGREPERSPR